MRRPPIADLAVLPVVLFAGALLWLLHAQAWDLGGRSAYLAYDSAQVAVAARELAFRGELRTLFALPADLPRHAPPPWPTAGLAPGLILLQAAVFRLMPALGGLTRSDTRAALTLIVPFVSYLFVAAALALAVRHLIGRWRPATPAWQRIGASLVLALTFLLDPAAQQFAMGAHAELPWLAGLVLLTLGLALGAAGERPWVFGLVLGAASLFRLQMVALAPVFALLAAWTARRDDAGAPSPGRGRRVAWLALGGFALVVAPVWWHEARVLGSPLGDVQRLLLWDGRDGRAWFAAMHQALPLPLPEPGEWPAWCARKLAANVPELLSAFARGPRLFELLALLALAAAPGLARPLRAAAIAGAVTFAAGLVASALAVPWYATWFPGRMLAGLAGLLSAWALVVRAGERLGGAVVRNALLVAIAALALGWGIVQTRQGLHAARTAAAGRAAPSALALRELGAQLNPRLTPREVLMSNLGPVLAWYTGHAVIHLAHTPEDVEPARRFVDFRNVLLVFRENDTGWAPWREIVERPGAAGVHPALRVRAEERWRTSDGYVVVWLQLAPRDPGLAAHPPAPAAPAPLTAAAPGAR